MILSELRLFDTREFSSKILSTQILEKVNFSFAQVLALPKLESPGHSGIEYNPTKSQTAKQTSSYDYHHRHESRSSQSDTEGQEASA